MASLTLKNVPDDLLRALRKAAEVDRRSMNQEIVHLLSGILGRRSERPAAPSPESAAQVAAWRKLAGKWRSDVERSREAEEIVRRLTPGREVKL